MACEREERLLKLAAEMEELGLRQEPHDIRNLLDTVGALRALARTFEDELQRLRGVILGPQKPKEESK